MVIKIVVESALLYTVTSIIALACEFARSNAILIFLVAVSHKDHL